MKRIKDIYWKIFFAAYWLAKDLGEKDSPQWNASGFMELNSITLANALIFLISSIDGEKRPVYKFIIVLSVALSIIINELILRSKKIGFRKRIKSYEYLSKPEMKKIRIRIVIITFLISLSGLLVSGIFANLISHHN